VDPRIKSQRKHSTGTAIKLSTGRVFGAKERAASRCGDLFRWRACPLSSLTLISSFPFDFFCTAFDSRPGSNHAEGYDCFGPHQLRTVAYSSLRQSSQPVRASAPPLAHRADIRRSSVEFACYTGAVVLRSPTCAGGRNRALKVASIITEARTVFRMLGERRDVGESMLSTRLRH